MPPEIADSDAESDLCSPQRPSTSPITEGACEIQPPSTLEQDPFANLEFDQFLSPTQRLSSAIERQENSHPRSISSSDKFLQEIAQADDRPNASIQDGDHLNSSMEHKYPAISRVSNKRSMSEIECGSIKRKHDGDFEQKHVKRIKTYATSRSQRSDVSHFFPSSPNTSGPRAQIAPAIASTSSDLPVKQLIDPNTASEGPRDQDLPSVPAHSLQQQGATSFLQGNIQSTSATRSSVAGYAGININFRGAGLGFDASANPFGSLSQISSDLDVNPQQTERFTSLFRYSEQSLCDEPAGGKSSNIAPPRKNVLEEMATSSPLNVELTAVKTLPESVGHVEHGAKDCSEIILNVSGHEQGPGEIELITTPARSLKKNRGRKSKSDGAGKKPLKSDSDDFEQPQHHDLSNMPREICQPIQNRSRIGTADSYQEDLSHISETDNKIESKRQKSTSTIQSERPIIKSVSSELNLSDPAMVGAPREMYVPRPSKSRSKRVIDDDEDELQKSEPSSVQQSLVKAAEQKSTSSGKQSLQKSKVKRAKTSAVTLLKSTEMYDEDDKDCILVDELPAKISIDPLPEIRPTKQESKSRVQDNGKSDPSTREELSKPSEHQSEHKFLIDIPPLSKEHDIQTIAPMKEPKKRGRKPKKKPEIQILEELDTTDQTNQLQTLENESTISEGERSRPVLSDKDINTSSTSTASAAATTKQSDHSETPTKPTCPTATPSTSPQKPVHSPLKPASRSSTPSNTNTSTNNSTSSPAGNLWSKPRVGLSRRTAIPSLLRNLNRGKEPPKLLERKDKLSKRQQEDEAKRRLQAEDSGEVYVDKWEMRGKDGMLVEWDE